MAKNKNKQSTVQGSNGQFSVSIGKDTLNALLVPISILLAGLFITVSVLYSANTILGKDQLVTKQNLASAVTDALKNANLTTTTGTTDTTNQDTGPVLAKTTVENSPREGNSKATVAIVEFSDYECPFCQRHYKETYGQIKQNYIDNGKVLLVYRNNPLSFHEPAASTAAEGMLCAKEMGGDSAYFKLHDLYFQNTQANGQGLVGGNEKFADYAAQVGLDRAKFLDCLGKSKFKDIITKDMNAAAAAGASGTPGFVIGKLNSDGTVDGELIAGAYPYSTFQATIDKYLNS